MYNIVYRDGSSVYHIDLEAEGGIFSLATAHGVVRFLSQDGLPLAQVQTQYALKKIPVTTTWACVGHGFVRCDGKEVA